MISLKDLSLFVSSPQVLKFLRYWCVLLKLRSIAAEVSLAWCAEALDSDLFVCELRLRSGHEVLGPFERLEHWGDPERAGQPCC